MNGLGADDRGQSAGFCGLQCEQRHDVWSVAGVRRGGVGMKVDRRSGPRYADSGGAVVALEIVTLVAYRKQILVLGVLRYRLRQVRRDSPIYDGGFVVSVAIDRQAANDHEAAAGFELAAQTGGVRGE